MKGYLQMVTIAIKGAVGASWRGQHGSGPSRSSGGRRLGKVSDDGSVGREADEVGASQGVQVVDVVEREASAGIGFERGPDEDGGGDLGERVRAVRRVLEGLMIRHSRTGEGNASLRHGLARVDAARSEPGLLEQQQHADEAREEGRHR